MSYPHRIAVTLMFCAFIGLIRYAYAGMQIEVADPLYFQRPHEVIFPWADVKLVSFEFASVTDDNLGKQRAKELHDLFLSKIQGLPGGAVLTYITPPGERIDNYRFTAEKVAIEQKAQMALWGRILLNEGEVPLINARLVLVYPPPGVSAEIQKRVLLPHGEPLPVVGEITDRVSQTRIDFKTIENDVTPLSEFLSGLAFYYKGASKVAPNSARLLGTAVDHFKEYLRLSARNTDVASAAVCNLYLARGLYLLAERRPAERTLWLRKAREHAEEAAALNPFEADAYTVQSVI